MRKWLEEQVNAILQSRTEVRLAPLQDALSHLRTAVPAPRDVDAREQDPTLPWSTEDTSMSGPVASALWDLMELVDAADEEIAGFAGRFGPLVWPADGTDGTDGPSSSHGIELVEREFCEPIWAWRGFARGVRALYDLLDPSLPPAAVPPDATGDAVAAVAIPLWLQASDRPAKPSTDGFPDVMTNFLATQRLDGPGWTSEWLVSLALSLAGAGPSYRSGYEANAVPAYTLPAASVVTAGAHAWQVRGLFPIVAVSLAIALQTEERARCTRCGRPAAILNRGPREGREWYGDHTWCRVSARAETMLRADDKRAQSRKRAKGEVGSPAHRATHPQESVGGD